MAFFMGFTVLLTQVEFKLDLACGNAGLEFGVPALAGRASERQHAPEIFLAHFVIARAAG